jgi:hypothetical protein
MQRLNGRVAILRYLGIRSRTTLRKWRTLGLPVYQTPTGRVFALCAEIDAWRRPPGLRKGVTRERRGGQKAGSLTAFMRGLLDAPVKDKGRTAESKR